MPHIIFYPGSHSIEPQSGTSLLEVAQQLGIPLRHDCGGFATCSTCRVWVESGIENLTEIDLDEENMLEEAELPTPYRLSCQAKIREDALGDVSVLMPGEAMEWSTGALRELKALPDTLRDIIRIIVENRARQKGISVILPDTAIPFVADAKRDVEAATNNRSAMTDLLRTLSDPSPRTDKIAQGHL